MIDALVRRREQARIRQRQYRANVARIDYHPDQHALRVIDFLRKPSAGGGASSIINQIIRQWGARRKAALPEFPDRYTRARQKLTKTQVEVMPLSVRNTESSG